MKYSDFIHAEPIYISGALDLPTVVNWIDWYFMGSRHKLHGDLIAKRSFELYASTPHTIMFSGTKPIEVTFNKPGQAQLVINIDVFEEVKNSEFEDGKDWVNAKAVINLFTISDNRIEVQCIYNHSYFRYYLSEIFSTMNKRWPVTSEDKHITIESEQSSIETEQKDNPSQSKLDDEKNQIVYRVGKSGVPPKKEYDDAFAKIKNGMTQQQAYDEYRIEANGLMHDKPLWDAFKAAMLRRANKQGIKIRKDT